MSILPTVLVRHTDSKLSSAHSSLLPLNITLPRSDSQIQWCTATVTKHFTAIMSVQLFCIHGLSSLATRERVIIIKNNILRAWWEMKENGWWRKAKKTVEEKQGPSRGKQVSHTLRKGRAKSSRWNFLKLTKKGFCFSKWQKGGSRDKTWRDVGQETEQGI